VWKNHIYDKTLMARAMRLLGRMDVKQTCVHRVAHQFGAPSDTKLVDDVRPMGFNRPQRDMQHLGYFGVCVAESQQAQYLFFPLRQGRRRRLLRGCRVSSE
jgi:hypothetical protein